MNNEQLDNFTANNVRLTYAQIFRDDQFGPWSFKEIGYRLQKGHPDLIDKNKDFTLIEIPRDVRGDNAWEIAKRQLVKGKSARKIQDLLNYIERRDYLCKVFNNNPKAKLG